MNKEQEMADHKAYIRSLEELRVELGALSADLLDGQSLELSALQESIKRGTRQNEIATHILKVLKQKNALQENEVAILESKALQIEQKVRSKLLSKVDQKLASSQEQTSQQNIESNKHQTFHATKQLDATQQKTIQSSNDLPTKFLRELNLPNPIKPSQPDQNSLQEMKKELRRLEAEATQKELQERRDRIASMQSELNLDKQRMHAEIARLRQEKERLGEQLAAFRLSSV